MAHNIDSMAYYGERPWHGLGTSIPARANASRIIGAARLNWEVAMRPIPNVGALADKNLLVSNADDGRGSVSTWRLSTRALRSSATRRRGRSDGNVWPNFSRTGTLHDLRPDHALWGAHNSVTRFEDYRHANEAWPDRRLNRIWFGQGADLKLHALQQADALRQQLSEARRCG